MGILACGDPRAHGVARVHVWGYDALLDALPREDWLVRHSPAALKKSIVHQLWWQRRSLPHEAEDAGIDILLNTDAGSICRWHPSVTMSRDMLSYEPGEMSRYFFSRMWLRLLVLRYVQAWSLKDADGAVFLTQYAADVIQRVSGRLPRLAIIPHGVSASFRQKRSRKATVGTPLRCLYVSQTDLYKHQWVVVRAVAELRRRGHDVTLLLAGGGETRAQQLLDAEIQRSDPDRLFVTQRGFVAQRDLPALLSDADVFVFASSCENMPNTLIEAMASQLPIACSNRGPMPEVLGDAGVYFDPEDSESVAAALDRLISEPGLREKLGARASERSREFSWERCAAQTWAFLHATLASVRGVRARLEIHSAVAT